MTVLLGACSKREKRYERVLMGTLGRVTVYGESDARSQAVADAVFAEWERINRAYSPQDSDSLLSRIVREAPNGWVPLDDEGYRLFQKSLGWRALSGGSFDVTFPPLWELWGRAAKAGREPSNEEISEALKQAGSEAVQLDPEYSAVRFLKPRRVDFGGVCKDHALYRGHEILKAMLPEGLALLDLGGDLVAYGRKPGGWHIGVRHPLRGDRLLGELSFPEGAVLTSGCYERFVTVAGKDRCHILDAKTARPLEDFSSLTVYLPSIEATHDPSVVYALMGRERGLSQVRALPGALAVWADLQGRVREASSPDSPARWTPAP